MTSKRYIFLYQCLFIGIISLVILSSWLQAKQAAMFYPKIYLGQSYPSGRVYLRTPDDHSKSAWPKQLNIIPISYFADTDKKPHNPLKTVAAIYQRPLKENIIKHRTVTVHIPNYEQMDANHTFCGLPKNKHQKKKRNLNFRYYSDDFFSTISDYCQSLEGVHLYQAKPSTMSYMVVAVPVSTKVKSVRYLKGKRPLSFREKKEIEKWKREMAAQNKKYKCTYEPVYINSASLIASIQLEGNPTTLRLSYYFDFGCAGHQSVVYLIDVMDKNKIRQRYFYVQNQGAL